MDPDQTAVYEASNILVDDKKNIHLVIMCFKG